MPFIDENVLLNATQSGTATEVKEDKVEAPEEETGFVDATAAFFKRENPIAGVAKILGVGLEEPSNEIDPDFDVLSVIKDENPEVLGHLDNFTDVVNREQYARKVFDMQYENEQREIFDKAPTITKLAAGMAASISDPLILVPYVGIAKNINRATRLAKGAAFGVTAAAGAGVVREGILQASQETRTTEESIFNTVAEAALGGIIGAAAGALANPIKGAGKALYARALAGEDFNIKVDVEEGLTTLKLQPDDISAMSRMSELDRLGLANINERLAKIISGPEALRSPELRSILSKTEVNRKLGEVMYKSNFIRNKNLVGDATEVNAQNAIAQRDSVTMRTIQATNKLYMNYTGKGIVGSSIGRAKGKISLDEFSERAWRALTDEKHIDDIAEVNLAAKAMRKDMDVVLRDLQELKMLPENLDPKFVKQYMTRIYDLEVLSVPRQQLKFTNTVKEWVRTHHQDTKVRSIPLDDGKAQDLAEEIVDKIRGESEQQISMSAISENFIAKGKFLKERQLLIPDSEIAEFLQKDSIRLYKNYMEKSAKLIETQKALHRAGFNDFSDAIKQIRFETQKTLRGASDKDAIKIAAQGVKEEDLAKLTYRSMLGQLKKPGKGDRYVQALLNYQFVRLLGGVTISSLPELVMAPFRFGFARTFRDGYLPMLKSFKQANMTKNQLDDLVATIEIESSKILESLGGVENTGNIGRKVTKFDKASSLIVDTFAKATGITHFTSMGRRMAAQVSSAGMVRAIKRGVTTKEMKMLASGGIDKTMLSRISKQIDDHVQNLNGSFVINPHLWKDDEALRAFTNAIQTDVESTILKPGVESLPFFVQQHGMAKVIFQFKSFMSAATGKVAISGLQRKDATAITGLISLITMGALSGMAHDAIKGKELDASFDELLLDGISRSGVLGLISTVVLDIGHSYYNEKTRKYGGKTVASNITGPTVGQLEEVSKAVANLADGEVTEKDTKAALRQLPFMNLFYIKAITERLFKEDK